MLKANELRKKYLEFFQSKGHQVIGSASLIPENDPTVLFTTAGMHPLVPYLMGEKHPGGTRLADCQKCVRTGDVEEVGDTTHHTFFEMLGNWSLGDYFKKEAIEWSWEFLTSPEWLGLDKNLLAVSVFAGDEDAPSDEEAYNIWKNLGIAEKRIARLPKKNNWWGPAGVTGPCGPDTEMFYWAGDPDKVQEGFNDDNDLWVEIWNDVFMQYNKTTDGKYELLEQKNVDTGMGLERVLSVLNKLYDDYKTDLFVNLIFKIEMLSGKKYGESDDVTRAMRIIADHIKAATFIMGDDKGVVPSNTDQGYVVRRLIRRAIRYGRQLGIASEEPWTKELAKIIAHDYGEVYPELKKNINKVINNFTEEENKFKKTIERGLKVLHSQMKAHEKKPGEKVIINKIASEDLNLAIINEDDINGKKLFDIYQTYGFPLELSLEELKQIWELDNYKIDQIHKEFRDAMQKHQDLSRTASAGMFKGGLADSGEETRKLHTAAHLMLAALRIVLGNHVVQKGSNITPERLRFDFSHPEKMAPEQIKKVEELVNEAIGKKMKVTCDEMTLDEARAKNAMGVFESKYGEKVKVYTMGDFSKEICGGPHVENTGELGHFRIQKEESSSAGVRRIKAVLE